MSNRFIGDAAVLVSVAVVAGMVMCAYRRSRALQLNPVDSENLEKIFLRPTPEDVRAAEESIRVKTNFAVAKAKKLLIRSMLLFVVLTLSSWPFLYGRPLYAYFRPWGQLFIACSSLAFSLVLITSVGFLTNWWFRKKTIELMNSLRDDEIGSR